MQLYMRYTSIININILALENALDKDQILDKDKILNRNKILDREKIIISGLAVQKSLH